MSKLIDEIYGRAEEFSEKYQDKDLYDWILHLANRVEQLEMVRHHFGYFVMHAQAVAPYDVRPRHFQEALERAKKVLKETGDD